MDYKRIIKSRSTRSKILRFLRFIPDKQMLKLQYRIKMGRSLNLKNPQRFTEKLQWYKLYYKNPVLIQCVDKYDVREYVKSKGLEDILIPCYGVYDTVARINWNGLPAQFVMKDTLSGGGTGVIIVKDKKSTDIEELKRRGSKWTSTPVLRGSGREWPYYSGKNHRIIIEEYIGSTAENTTGLEDYKFFCFNGRVEFIYVMGNRVNGQSVACTIMDKNFNPLPVTRVGDQPYNNYKKPSNFDEMEMIAEQLAADFPHVRVDLYSVDGKVLFGELTFYNASGYMVFDPDSFDMEIGNKFDLKNIQ